MTDRLSRRLRAAYAVLAVVDTALAGSGHPRAYRLRRVTKPLLMPVLAGSLALDPAARRSPLRGSTLLAQAAGLAGDVFLLGERRADFLRGSAAFGVGHLAYIAGFWAHRGPARPAPALAVAASWAATAPLLAIAAGRQDRRLGPVVAAYAALLAGTTAASTQLDPALPAGARRACVAGATLFMLSDALIGVRTFVLDDPPAWTDAAVMSTYTAGQYLLSAGAARAGD